MGLGNLIGLYICYILCAYRSACNCCGFCLLNLLEPFPELWGCLIISFPGIEFLTCYSFSRWVLKCHACFKVTTEIGRIFCPTCGNGGTLRKVAVTVNENGIVLASRRPRISLRGTKVVIHFLQQLCFFGSLFCYKFCIAALVLCG